MFKIILLGVAFGIILGLIIRLLTRVYKKFQDVNDEFLSKELE